MYLTRVEIQNIRAISHLVWEIEPENAAGWHVILGDNGAGKSTFVRGTVLACVGYDEALRLRHYTENWLENKAEKFGYVKVEYLFDAKYDPYKRLEGGESKFQIMRSYEGKIPDMYRISDFSNASPETETLENLRRTNNAFFASFGPFRRFVSGQAKDDDLFESNPVLRRHRTTFSDYLALSSVLAWLELTKFKALEKDTASEKLIDNIKTFINQGDLLPYNTKFVDINSSGVHFVDGNGASVAAEELSDGYRSVLSLTFELLRLLSLTHGPDIFETGENGAITVAPPGVVLIDEVDAHLHPTWQKRIGFWLRKHFPKMQWIVTTHSPLICQAAEKGTIYKLPTPGTDETGRMLEGGEYDRLVYGDILDAYSTEAFGAGITRSEASQEKLDRLSELNVKEIISGLTPEESKEQEELRAMLPTTAAALPDEGLPV